MAGYDRYEGALYIPKTRCPAGCKPCAKCMREDEDNLRALPQRPECDCNQPPVEDSCFEPDSCACWCDKRKGALSACPPP